MKIHKIYIAFDLDEVLIDLMTPVKKLLLEIHGIKLKENNPKYNQFELTTPTGLSSKELWKIFRMAYKEIKDTPIILEPQNYWPNYTRKLIILQ